MADSDLYMQCDEDDLEPCQSITENRDQRYNKVTVVQSSNNALIPAQSDGASERTSAATELVNQAVPMVSAPAVTLMPNAVPPGGAAGPALGQTIYISAQPNPSQHLAGPMSLGTSLGYIFNGQPISFLTAGPTPQLIAQRMVTPSVQQTTPGKISTLQIPVTLTINSASNIQSITSSAPGVSTLNVTPSNVLPATAAPGTTIKVIKFTKLPGAPAAAGQVMNSLMQSTKTVTIQNNVTSRAPAPLMCAGMSQTARPQLQIFSPPAATTTNALKRASSSANFCVCCKAFYQKSQSLRGFFCQCNQELLKGVQDLKAQVKKRTKRSSDKTPSKPSTSETPVSFSTSSETSLKHVTTSEIPEGVPSPRSGDFDDQGRMIVLVEDFFYGQHPGQPAPRTNLGPITMKCQLCDKKMKGNIKMMNHMKHHMELDHQTGKVDSHTMCQHCLRNFTTPFSLQCHVEAVHSQAESSKVCKICELSFENEPLFLNHMKQSHKPGEMPYMCQVCEFRSSFYQDVISHFSEQHKDTCILLCPFCLKVFRSCGGFQLHYTRHQNRAAHHCSRCRLQFTREKDEWHHRQRFHKTCVKPKQLEGLTPGTRVIIRAYARNTGNREHLGAPPLKTRSNVTRTTAARRNVTSKVIPVKKKPVESMMELMVKFESQCKPTEKHFCMECTYDIPYFSNHFPTYVSCSLCRYCTCCSRAYANHMISVHVPRKSTKKYIALYKPCPKKGRLTCTTCRFKTRVGDSMAKHLADHPNHQASRSTLQEGFSRGYKRFVFIPTDLLRGGQILNNAFFLPLQVKQVGNSLPLSSKPLPQKRFSIMLPASPAHAASFPIKVQPVEQSAIGAAKPDASKQSLSGGLSKVDTRRTAENSLTLVQLKVVLYALCFGVPQAANRFNTPPEEVQSLLLKRQSQLEPSRRREGLTPQAADRLIEWVLCQREQQLPVDDANLFDFMSRHGARDISYDSVVDFLLRHDLGLQAFATSSKLLPDKSQELESSFSSFLKKQVNSQTFRLSSMAAMDELSIFVDMEQLEGASAVSSSMLSAFKLVGTTNPLIEVVFTALADGRLLPTMLFLRAEPLDSHSLPDFIILEARPQGFTDEERLQLWFDKVWRRHVNPSSGGKGLLIIDTYKGHTSNEFLAALNSANTLPGLIPRGCSRRLQPLEACMGPVLREFLQARWSDHVTTAKQDLIGAKPADLVLLLFRWLVEVLHVLNAEPKLLFRSFDRVLGTNPGMAFEEPSELVRSLTEALLVSKLQGDKAEEKKAETSSVSAESWSSPQSSLLSLKKIFEKDSDVESFLGFEDSEIMDHCSSLTE